LPEGEVHVWLVRLEQNTSSRGWVHLVDEERTRAGRFRMEKDRARFVQSHGALREILGAMLGIPPRLLGFAADEGGKPRLVQPTSGPSFNLSHSGDLALIAVARGIEVGVDVEHVRPGASLESVAERIFGPSEREALDVLDPALRQRVFFDGWARKEALLKAMGTGIAAPLDALEVSLARDDQDALRSIRGNVDEAGTWRLRSLDVGAGYAAAVAGKGRDWALERWAFDAPS
jgi:4'-phosphopantetheinyl transferase